MCYDYYIQEIGTEGFGCINKIINVHNLHVKYEQPKCMPWVPVCCAPYSFRAYDTNFFLSIFHSATGNTIVDVFVL